MNNLIQKNIGFSFGQRQKKFFLSGSTIKDTYEYTIDKIRKDQFFCILNKNLTDYTINILDIEDNILSSSNSNQIKNLINHKDLNQNSHKIQIVCNQELYILKFKSLTDLKNWNLDIIESNTSFLYSESTYFGILLSDAKFNFNGDEIYNTQLSPNQTNVIEIDSNAQNSILHIYSFDGVVLEN
jgi:hypothetical protein